MACLEALDEASQSQTLNPRADGFILSLFEQVIDFSCFAFVVGSSSITVSVKEWFEEGVSFPFPPDSD